MFIEAAPLAKLATELRSGKRDVLDYIDHICDRIDFLDGRLHALLPEPDRRLRLHREARALRAKYPTEAERPPLFGVLIGVKDIFNAAGFDTQAGSRLPSALFVGEESAVVRQLKALGALIVGKTVTAEFAYIDPGPTRNPHHLEHTPGGSSSGSAAGVAAGFFALAVGTQTIGSTIRPAAYCGIVGFKPSYGRLSTVGVLPVSKALDHVGLFTQDLDGMNLAAGLLLLGWQAASETSARPVLGVPIGPYLDQASEPARQIFDEAVHRLESAGYAVKKVPMFADLKTIAARTVRLMAVEAAEVHKAWFAAYEDRYGPQITGLIRTGQGVDSAEYVALLAFQKQSQADIAATMRAEGIDLWITPAATSSAPLGLASTGVSAMNLPWTLLGLPALTLPDRALSDGLPMGVQCVGGLNADEALLRDSFGIARAIDSASVAI